MGRTVNSSSDFSLAKITNWISNFARASNTGGWVKFKFDFESILNYANDVSKKSSVKYNYTKK